MKNLNSPIKKPKSYFPSPQNSEKKNTVSHFLNFLVSGSKESWILMSDLVSLWKSPLYMRTDGEREINS